MSESSRPCGDHEWRAALDGLPDGERRIVLDAVAGGIGSGWNRHVETSIGGFPWRAK
jgi:hypothetical protein